MDTDTLRQHKELAKIIARKLMYAKRHNVSISPKDVNDLEIHKQALDSVHESYNFALYWAQKSADDGKDIEVIRRHLLAAEKARLKLKKFNIEKNKARLAKEMELRKQFDLPV